MWLRLYLMALVAVILSLLLYVGLLPKMVSARDSLADVRRKEAKAEADATLMKAAAEADAIAKVGEALNKYPQMKELRSIEKWNGQLPTYMTNGTPTPFVTVK